MYDKEVIGKKIQYCRIRKGLTQQELGELTLFSRSKISNIENGRKYIDNILDYEAGTQTTYIEDLKYIPKGGLKGLIYYKLIVATNKKLNLD